ncbi:50S ribosomal protein L24 [bacterium]|nr:50S ribosomal protein L24 [bacterium]MCK4437057.1 50S ribosomal protein L24 [bacterium]
MNVRKGDMVQAVTGRDKGKTGKVLRVFPKKERVIVEGINFVKRHTKAQPPEQQGGILKKEASIHISNVMVYCPRCNKATRVGHRKLEDGTKSRLCRRCGELIGK